MILEFYKPKDSPVDPESIEHALQESFDDVAVSETGKYLSVCANNKKYLPLSSYDEKHPEESLSLVSVIR